MRPEISKLITPLIYQNLEDHTSVKNYGGIQGVSKNVFFLEHNEFEEEVSKVEFLKNYVILFTFEIDIFKDR